MRKRSSLTELRRLVARHGSPDLDPLRMLPNVKLLTAVATTRPFGYVYEPVFALVAQGSKRIALGDKTFDCSAGRYLIVPVDLPLDTQILGATAQVPFLTFSLRLKAETIANLVLEGGAPRVGSNDPPGIAVTDLTDDLIDPVIRLLRLLERPADIPVLAGAIEREIIWRLLNGAQGALVRQIGLADSRMAQIARAIRSLRGHYAKPIRIEELARMAGMSVTSFHRHFRAITSMTPIQYQKQIRLQAARARLMSTAATVAEVGFAVGYDSLSQFNREYRRQFGRPPGRDGKSLRQSKDRAGAHATHEPSTRRTS